MTQISIEVPARITHTPRAADFLAQAALAASRMVVRGVTVVLDGLRSRHLLAQGTGYAPHAETRCADGIGPIKG